MILTCPPILSCTVFLSIAAVPVSSGLLNTLGNNAALYNCLHTDYRSSTLAEAKKDYIIREFRREARVGKRQCEKS